MKKKEIFYISDSCIPSYSADSIHVMKMCQAFSYQGYQVTLVGKRTRNMVKGVSNVYSFYGVESCFNIELFPFRPFKFSGRLYNLAIPFFALKSKLFVYTRSIYAAFWYSAFKKEIVFEIHEPFNTKNWWLKKLFQFIVKRNVVKNWVVISSPLKDHLLNEFLIDANSIFLAHDGADIAENQFEENSIPNNKFKVGYVGSLYKGKGMEIILPLSRKMKDVEFHVVGGNNDQLKLWKDQLGENQRNLIFHGYQSPKNSQKYISQFDVLLAPYLEKVFVKDNGLSNNLAKWMSPLKIFEYMAHGKPIIATNLPVIKDILTDKVSALLCDSEALDQWENSIIQIERSPELAIKLGENAKKNLETKFTWDVRARNILEFLKKD